MIVKAIYFDILQLIYGVDFKVDSTDILNRRFFAFIWDTLLGNLFRFVIRIVCRYIGTSTTFLSLLES